MKTLIKDLSRPVFFELYKRSRSAFWIAPLRKTCNIQLTTRQIVRICECLNETSRPSFLVFGLGNDSLFWDATNHNGVTLFLEDNREWMTRVLGKHPHLKAAPIHYSTKRSDWEDLIGCDERLALPLPPQATERKWDVVLVDAPAGFRDTEPGRMQSIFAASQLARAGGTVFLHDCDRIVEKTYGSLYLKDSNLRGQIGNLNEYVLL